jgi:hypothetical protein
MNKAIFYTKINGSTFELWGKVIAENDDLIRDVRLDNNAEYASVSGWKNHNLDFQADLSELSNELYHYYFMPVIYKFLRFQEIHKIQKIKFIGDHPDFYLAAGYFLEKKIEIDGLKLSKLKGFRLLIIRTFLYLKTQIISAGVIFLKGIQNIRVVPYKSNVKSNFALIHSKAAYGNIRKLNLDLVYFYDDINLGKISNKRTIPFYQLISSIEYIGLFIQSFLLTHYVLKRLLATSEIMLGGVGTIKAMDFFSKRVGHFVLIKKAYENIFNEHRESQFYSGERESRYSVLAMELSKNSGNTAIAIPHGMAYSYKYPLGLFGHKYYCTSLEESKYLNDAYNDKKFVFDMHITSTLYKRGGFGDDGLKIVFFTEPRRPSVNLVIIENITRLLNQTLFLKLHPLEDADYYKGVTGIKFIDSLDEAICSNICISRKSTVLVEALFNDSRSIAILVDEQDAYEFDNIFPALSDPRISKSYSFEDLFIHLENAV